MSEPTDIIPGERDMEAAEKCVEDLCLDHNYVRGSIPVIARYIAKARAEERERLAALMSDLKGKLVSVLDENTDHYEPVIEMVMDKVIEAVVVATGFRVKP